MRDLYHFELLVEEVPEAIHQNLTTDYLYCLQSVAYPEVRLKADSMHFHWGTAGDDWHEFEGVHSPIPESERTGAKWNFEYYDAEEEVYVCPKGDGRIDSFEELDPALAQTLRRALVLDLKYPIDKPCFFLTLRLAPGLHTVRFVNTDARPEIIHEHPAAPRVVYFDQPGKWIKPNASALAAQVPHWERSIRFSICSDQTTKVVINQTYRRQWANREAMFPPVPKRPAKLRDLVYVFKRWDAKGDARFSGLRMFFALVTWAAGHDIRATVVNAQDLDPRIVTGKTDAMADEVVEVLQGQIKEQAELIVHNPDAPFFVPTEDLVNKVASNTTFVTLDEYQEMLGLENFEIETTVDLHTRPSHLA